MAVESGSEFVIIEEDGPLTTIRLNKPEKLNAWSTDMDHAIGDYLRSLNRTDYDTRCVIITGEGRAFCSGADVGNFPQSGSPAGEARARQVWHVPHSEHVTTQAIRDCDVPVIGAINGFAIGLGFGLALAPDLRIAADDARFQVTQLHRGLVGDFGLAHFLTEALGPQQALDLMMTGRWVDADEALQLGLVLEVVPRDQLMERAMERARELAKGPALAIAASKRAVYMSSMDGFRRSQDWSTLTVQHLLKTEDNAEGIAAFRERREANFKGR